MNTVTIDKSNERVRRMFASIADKYDRMNHLLSMNVDKYWRWRTVRKVAPDGDGPILDVCTGTGDLALAFLKVSNGSVPIIASDFCPEMLDIGRKKAKTIDAGRRLEFVEADTQQLPFPEDYFQIVSVAFGLRNIANTDQGLREMVRVCRTDGRVAVLEFSMPSWQPMRGIYGWYFRRILPRIGQWLARNDDEAYTYLPESVGEFPCGAELVKRMTAAGLNDVRHFPLTFGIATLYVGRK